MQSASPTTERPGGAFARPQLIFFTELPVPALGEALSQPGLVDHLVSEGYGLSLGLVDLSPERAELVRRLNQRGVPVVAWLLLPPGEGSWLHLQNYPQAVARYRAFHAWARQHELRFAAVGLDIEPPAGGPDDRPWGLRELVRRLLLARENVLYPAARAAYAELIAEIHHDGYEVHVYQIPLVADDRRAGTSLLQRALDVVDLPADLEVLMCYSSFPVEYSGNDLGGALVASYGSSADAVGVGSTGSHGDGDGLPPLSWDALERDLLLASRHTDTIYVYSFEGCIERNLFGRLAQMDWDSEPHLPRARRAVIDALRVALLLVLLAARYSRRILAWTGWGLALILLFREARRWQRRRAHGPHADLPASH